MVSRRDLKSAHEDAVLRQFKAHLESSGSRLEIIERPEPPEAIVELDGNCAWIEITDAFLDKKHAIGLTSSAAGDVDHVPDDGRLVLNPDATFSAVLQGVINAKYDKATMQRISDAMGGLAFSWWASSRHSRRLKRWHTRRPLALLDSLRKSPCKSSALSTPTRGLAIEPSTFCIVTGHNNSFKPTPLRGTAQLRR
jgi:hypothetical protein